MVSAAGRVFYVMDEGPTESIQLPSEHFLTARDAFNVVVLWKRPLREWFNSLYPLKSGPGWMPRRLVAVQDDVYLAPGIGQDLLCLDAATGKVNCTAFSSFQPLRSTGCSPVLCNSINSTCSILTSGLRCISLITTATGVSSPIHNRIIKTEKRLI